MYSASSLPSQHTTRPPPLPAETCKWTRKDSHYAIKGHIDACPLKGTNPAQALLDDLFDDVEDAKAACLKAGDCVVVTHQRRRQDICDAKWRVVHDLKPELKTFANGFAAAEMYAYEAAPECLSKAPNLPHPSLTQSIKSSTRQSNAYTYMRTHTNAHTSYDPLR